MKFTRNNANNYLNSFQDADELKLLRSGPSFFEELHKMISIAKESIHIQMYIHNDDFTGRQVLQSLIEASTRGVEIYVVVDGFGSSSLTNEYIEELKKAGIYFKIYSKISLLKNLQIGRRLHHKLVVVDHKYALVGGINIADKYNLTTETEPWLDFAIYIRGAVCEKLERICFQIIQKRFYQKILTNGKPKLKLNSEHLRMSVRQNDWLRNKKQVYYSYIMAIRKAEKSILIYASYFLPGQRLKNALVHASRKGVKISIVLPGISDIPLALNATYYLYSWLHKNNIRIYEWKKSVMHAKLAIVDDNWMTIGSFNLNHLSAYASVELNIDVLNANFVTQCRDYLNNIITEGCEEISKDRKRPILVKVREAIAFVLGRALVHVITFFPNFKTYYSKLVD